MTQGFNSKVFQATKWSSITEIIAKVLSPITTMILARLLVPEMFGIMATITIVISFAELFTDAGFQKYIIQKEFKSKEDLIESTNVAFLTNLFLSILLWGVIIVFRDSLSDLFGKNKLGTAISIACVSLPLGAFSSIQMALFTRDLDFKIRKPRYTIIDHHSICNCFQKLLGSNCRYYSFKISQCNLFYI